MSIKDSIRGIFTRLEKKQIKKFHAIRKAELLVVEYKNLFVRRKEWKTYNLSNEQKKAIDEFYIKHYGKKVPYYWHRMYTNYTGNFDEKYIPEIIFSTKLEEKLNPYLIAFPLQNKNFNPQNLFSGLESKGIIAPKMVVSNCNDIFWDEHGIVVPKEDVKKLLNNKGELIIKPTIDTMGAKGVRLVDIVNGVDIRSQQTIEEILDEYKQDFIVQHRVINHNSIAQIYPHSVNTLRVITFVTKDGIQVAPLCMRIGVAGRVVDNAGIFIGVSMDGQLAKEGFSKKDIIRYEKHPDTNVCFADCKIDGVEKIVESAKYLHSLLPQLKMLSWDLAYDKDGNVVIIECNTTAQSVWFPQMVTGKSIFGEYTGDMLRLINKQK